MFARAFLLCCVLFSSLAGAQTYRGVEIVQAKLVPSVTAVVPGQTFTVGLHLRLASHWHTYWQASGDSGLPTKIAWKLPPGWRAGEIQWPIPIRLTEPGDLVTYAYEDEVVLFVELTPPAKLAGTEITLGAQASWLVCEKLCLPGKADLELQLPVAPQNQPANADLLDRFRAQLPETSALPYSTTWSTVADAVKLTVTGLQANQTLDFYPIPPVEVAAGHPSVAGAEITIPAVGAAKMPGLLVVREGANRLGWLVGFDPPTSAPGAGARSLWHFLLLGLLGGFILNLMPCVLPVIALKLLGFLKQAGESRQRIWRLGLAFVGGMFAWFLGLAVLVSAFKAAGHELNWAFQFQHPGFLVAMIGVILLFALNLFGLFEIVLPGKFNRRLDDLAAREGLGGAFLHGMFATLMATPCTAPFLGPALGFAFAQSTGVIFAMFGAIAFGMSFPYLILSAQPAWMRYLPRPGMWMVRLKKLMGVLLLGTALWLGWVLWQSQRERAPFAPQLTHALANEQQTIFVDFTADWCVNCKVNERFVLNTEPVQKAFRENNVRVLKADWTNGDPGITELLKKFGRAGVPLYVVYRAGHHDQPVVLPELITSQMVLEAIVP